MWSISKQPQFFLQPISLFSFALLLAWVFRSSSCTIHALITVGHVEKQVLFMVLLNTLKKQGIIHKWAWKVCELWDTQQQWKTEVYFGCEIKQVSNLSNFLLWRSVKRMGKKCVFIYTLPLELIKPSTVSRCSLLFSIYSDFGITFRMIKYHLAHPYFCLLSVRRVLIGLGKAK